jgi:hypothetical protein
VTAYFSTGAGGAAQAQLDALKALFNGGTLKVYTDAAPKDPDTAFTGALLATWTFSAAAFGADSVSGTFPNKTVTATASFAASTVAAAASGTAASFGLFDSSGNLRAAGSAGTSGADLNFNSAAFSSGANVTLSSFTLSQPQ